MMRAGRARKPYILDRWSSRRHVMVEESKDTPSDHSGSVDGAARAPKSARTHILRPYPHVFDSHSDMKAVNFSATNFGALRCNI
jgi:hypothetical protein